MHTTDRDLAIDQAMTAAERTTFLAAFTLLNPHWRGAHVADVLQVLGESDSHLEVVEPMYEAHEKEVSNPRLIGPATRAVYLVHGPEGVTWERVRELIARVERS